MNKELAKIYFVDLLQRAHAGEKAAAYAYQGHADSVSDPVEKKEILKIEEEEWHHRKRIFEIMSELGVKPRFWLEVLFTIIGKTISFFCYLGGWFIPMYGAGKLERGNIVEYEIAARLAHWAGLSSYIDELLQFAEVEWEHEQYYRLKAESHWLHKFVKIWPAPPPKSKIREEFQNFSTTNDFNCLATQVFTINRISRYQLDK